MAGSSIMRANLSTPSVRIDGLDNERDIYRYPIALSSFSMFYFLFKLGLI